MTYSSHRKPEPFVEPEIAEPWTQLRTDIFEESTGFRDGLL
jgi:hypothetical protein